MTTKFYGLSSKLVTQTEQALGRASQLVRKSMQSNLVVDGIDEAIDAAKVAIDMQATPRISLGGAVTTKLAQGTAATLITSPVSYARNAPEIEYWGNNPGTVFVSYTGNLVANGRHCAARFETNSNTVALRIYDGGFTGQVYVDGSRLSPTHIKPSDVVKDANGNAVTTNTAWVYEFTLPPSVEADGTPKWRHIELVGFLMALGAVFVETGRAIRKPIGPRASLKRVWQLGDSYTHGVGPIDSTYIDLRMACDYYGLQCLQNGIGGSGWTSTAGQYPATRVTSELGALNAQPDYVILSLGYNTYANGIANEAAVVTSIRECVAAVRAAAPNAKILGISCATPVGLTDNLREGNRVIGATYAALGIPFLNVSEAITAGNSKAYGAETVPVHNNTSGYEARAQALIPELRKYL